MTIKDLLRMVMILALITAAVLAYNIDDAESADPNLTQFTSKDTRIAVGPSYVTWEVLK